MRLHTGAKLMLAASTIVGGLGAWAALDESGSNLCHATMGPVRAARAGALRAVEAASEFDTDTRDMAAMALQRWQATLEQATRACGFAPS